LRHAQRNQRNFIFMSSAAHKRIIFAGMGCAAGLTGLIVAGVVLALREKPGLLSEIAAVSEYATPSTAAKALDSLQRFDWGFLDRPHTDRLALTTSGIGNGAMVALQVWNRPRLRFGIIPFGDSAADSSRSREIWHSHAVQPWVDSLIAAARQPWRLTDGAIATVSPGGAVLKTTLSAYPVLNTTRAILARADLRWPHDSAAARQAVQATITIGRALQVDGPLIHRLIGLQVEREALFFLYSRDTASSELESHLNEVDDAVELGLIGLRLIRVAGGVADNAAALARAALDEELPVAVRRELLISVGYGWSFNMLEGGTVMLRADRAAALKAIDSTALPAVLRGTLADARATAQLDLARRMVLGPEYQTLTSSLRATW
jgi:hypothetical protein